jgi:hypothetical protein
MKEFIAIEMKTNLLFKGAPCPNPPTGTTQSKY